MHSQKTGLIANKINSTLITIPRQFSQSIGDIPFNHRANQEVRLPPWRATSNRIINMGGLTLVAKDNITSMITHRTLADDALASFTLGGVGNFLETH